MSRPAGKGGRTSVTLGGTRLTVDDVFVVACQAAEVKIAAAGRRRAQLSHEAIAGIRARRPVYGQTTGVGANKTAKVHKDEAEAHAERLLRSHAAGAGPLAAKESVRAMLVVRANQLAAGGSGVDPAVPDILAAALNQDLTPPIMKYGAIGTGDLTALAVTALCITGERAWQGGSLPVHVLQDADALAFLSSNAATLGEAAVATHDIGQRLRAGLQVAALSHLALGGSTEAYAAVVHSSRSHSGQIAAADDLRRLLGSSAKQRRIQDPYCLRALPQVHGVATEALQHMCQVLETEFNAAAENPLVDVSSGDVFHNGNFYASYVGLKLDELRVAAYNTAVLSADRLKALMEPAMTTLRPFLAAGAEASSGVLIAEYVAHSALAELRHLAAPDSLGGAVLSRGTEEHASFATQSAWHTTASVAPYETIVACELVAAIRALRQQNIIPGGGSLRAAYDAAAAVLDADMDDRSLEADMASAVSCLRKF